MNNEGMRRMLQLMSTIGNGREEQANTRERGWAGQARQTNDERRGRPVGRLLGRQHHARVLLLDLLELARLLVHELALDLLQLFGRKLGELHEKQININIRIRYNEGSGDNNDGL